MATTTSAPSPFATDVPYTAGSDPGVGSASGSSGNGDAAGASGASDGSVQISHGALAAIIVIVCLIALFGILTSVLFYIAKKREWTIRETIRKSTRKVITALTPRRSEFPKSVKEGGPRSRGGAKGMRLDDVPPTPRIKPEHLDLEKGIDRRAKPGSKRGNFSRK